MKEKDFLTVKEVADYAGISVQAVYNRLEKDFKPYLKIENGKKQLNKGVLQLFETPKVSSEFKENFKPILNLLEKQNEQLQRELDIKNKQIEELSSELAKERTHSREFTDIVAVLADQSQRLQLEQIKSPVLLEANTSEKEPTKSRWKFWKK